jgi:hypothetical protein
MPRRPALPKDPSQRAKALLDMATGDKPREVLEETQAVKAGRKGGLAGGPARAKSLSKDERTKSASKAAKKRWSRQKTLAD